MVSKRLRLIVGRLGKNNTGQRQAAQMSMCSVPPEVASCFPPMVMRGAANSAAAGKMGKDMLGFSKSACGRLHCQGEYRAGLARTDNHHLSQFQGKISEDGQWPILARPDLHLRLRRHHCADRWRLASSAGQDVVGPAHVLASARQVFGGDLTCSLIRIVL